MSESRSPRDIARQVLSIESRAVAGLEDQLDESFDRAIALLSNCKGRVVCTGMGKSGLVMKKIAATLASTGTPSLFLHPAEAIHGDLGMIAEGDIVLAASYSGETQEIQRLVELVTRLGVDLIMLTGNPESPLARNATVHLKVAIDQEACPHNLAPTASSTATLAMGDALAIALSESKGFTSDDFARLHPGGALGKGLLKVREVMHAGADLPKVAGTASMQKVVREISAKGFGITSVVDDEGALVGCVTDGDLRRLVERGADLSSIQARECMAVDPQTIGSEELASAALKVMEDKRITALFVRDDRELKGLVHLHDLWRTQLF